MVPTWVYVFQILAIDLRPPDRAPTSANDIDVRAGELLAVGLKHLRHGLKSAHGSFEIPDRNGRSVEVTATDSVEKAAERSRSVPKLRSRERRWQGRDSLSASWHPRPRDDAAADGFRSKRPSFGSTSYPPLRPGCSAAHPRATVPANRQHHPMDAT